MSTYPNFKVECLAIISKQLSPLFIKDYTGKSEIEVQVVVHSSLDQVEELLSDAKTQRELYLGLIDFSERLNTYAYCTASRIVFLVNVRWQVVEPKDEEVKQLFTRIHQSYSSLVSNPFYSFDTAVDKGPCNRFEESINKICSV